MATPLSPPQDSIVANATPPGRGAISIVRVSGPTAAAIAQALCKSVPEPRRATLKTLFDQHGVAFDQAIVIYFAAPNSYTGEDMLEIQTHGGSPLVSICLQACIAAGARLAQAGEFSERAFLNNKLNLLQAEAIADLISASSERAARSAFNAMRGAFSEEVHALSNQLKSIRVEVEASIDFPEEEIPLPTLDRWLEGIERLSTKLDALITNARRGMKLNAGIDIAIVGSPNVGKSTLLNHLAGEDKAITSDIPGTTRDIVSVDVEYKGLSIRFHDTAGLRAATEDQIEAEGIRRTKKLIDEVDLCLQIKDISQHSTNTSDQPAEVADTPHIIVWNKIDVMGSAPRMTKDGDQIHCYLSARTGEGVTDLWDLIIEISGLTSEDESPYIARERHLNTLVAVRDLLQITDDTEALQATELLAENLRLAIRLLGELIGEYTNEDLLGDIFSTFCIGK